MCYLRAISALHLAQDLRGQNCHPSVSRTATAFSYVIPTTVRLIEHRRLSRCQRQATLSQWLLLNHGRHVLTLAVLQPRRHCPCPSGQAANVALQPLQPTPAHFARLARAKRLWAARDR